MKHFFTLFILCASMYCANAQSIYNQKWKESTFFQVPQTYKKQLINDDQAIFGLEDERAKLAIKEWPLSEKAKTTEALEWSAKQIAEQLDYSADDIESIESVIEDNSESNLIGIRLTLKTKNRKAFLTTLYSYKTDKNYIILVDANAKYFKRNTALVKKLSNGLVEL